MNAVHISSKSEDRKAFVKEFIANSGCNVVIYVCPKNIMWQAKESGITAYFVAFEDLTKNEQWLKINSMIGPQTALVMENVSRYPKITSEKVLYLQRLSMQITNKCVVDIVPFTQEISYLYTPYSYLDRSVLGFAHWYAFREGYNELNEEGTIVNSHDHYALAKKITGITSFGEETIIRDRRIINVTSSDKESKDQTKLRDALFAAKENPVKIVTQLADFTHAFDTRRNAVFSMVKDELADKKVLVLTNLSSYAKKYISAFKRGGLTQATADSFQVASGRDDLASFDVIIFAEHPITNTYFCLDIEAQCKRTAVVYQVCSDIKVCKYLFARYNAETTAIGSFTDALKSVQAL